MGFSVYMTVPLKSSVIGLVLSLSLQDTKLQGMALLKEECLKNTPPQVKAVSKIHSRISFQD